MTRTRTAKKTTAEAAPAPVKKAAAARKTTATASRRPASKRTPRKASNTKLALVPARDPLPVRDLPFMTDTQGYATLAARMVGILSPSIRDWRDHRDNTCTRKLRDGSTLHYDLTTRTLTWQAVCRMGAIHQYQLDSPSMACASRLHADGCKELHADLTAVPALTADELAALGLLKTPTWARPDLDITDTIPVPVESVHQAAASAAETQPISRDAIDAVLAAGAASADTEEPKEHPDHA